MNKQPTIEIIDQSLGNGRSCTVTIQVFDIDMILTDEGMHIYSPRFNTGTVAQPSYELIPYAQLEEPLRAFGPIIKDAAEELNEVDEFDDDGEQIEEVMEDHEQTISAAIDTIEALLDDDKVKAYLMSMAL